MRSWKLRCSALVLGTSLAVACGSGSSNDGPGGLGDGGSSSEPEAGGPSVSGSSGKGGSGSSGQGGDSGSDAGGGGPAGSGGDDTSTGGEKADGALPFTPSNVPAGSAEGVGALVLSDQDCVIDTDEGTISCVDDATLFRFSEVEQSDGPNLAVFAARSILIEQSA